MLHHARHGTDRGEGIKPVPQSAVPEDERVVIANTRDDLAWPGPILTRRLGGQTKRDYVDQSANVGVGLHLRQIESPGGRQRSEPEVALSLRRADEGVAQAQ